MLIWLFIIADRITVPDKERILWGFAYPQAAGCSRRAAREHLSCCNRVCLGSREDEDARGDSEASTVCPHHVAHCGWLTSHHRGLIPGQDAPDIVANTFLDQTSEEQLKKICYAFLSHRECKFVFQMSHYGC